ncbi:Uncharacterized protein YR821_0529 [Yersinia ruckeri]|nr:Uncharacterized protein YR821_0529 [Yersinia ruckeri]
MKKNYFLSHSRSLFPIAQIIIMPRALRDIDDFLLIHAIYTYSDIYPFF